MFGQQVIFKAANQLYSFDSMNVRSVEADYTLNPLPGAPECIVGVATLRDGVAPVISIYNKFNLRGTLRAGNNTIFVNTKDGCVGCLVDEITEIGAVGEDMQMSLPTIAKNDETNYVDGIIRHKDQLVTVVNPDKLLTAAEWSAVKKILGDE